MQDLSLRGALTLFTIKNNLDVVIYPQSLTLYSPKYHRGINVDQYGELSLSDSREDTPLLYREALMGAVPSKSRITVIAWLPKEDLASITEVRCVGMGIQGSLTKSSDKQSDGALVTYEIEFKPHKHTLDKGLAYTDNHGNVIPFCGIENDQIVGPNFTPDEVKSRTTSEDSWLLKYYFPMWIPRWGSHGVLSTYPSYWRMVHTTLEPQNKNPEDYWRATPGETNHSPFADWIVFGRGQTLKYEYSKFSYDQDDPRFLTGGTLYIARFIGNPEYRVLQRLRTIYWEDDSRFRIATQRSAISMEVSFLPYDEAAVNDESAFKRAYWDEREQKGEVQTIRFRSHFVVANMGPYHTEYNQMLMPNTDTGTPFWFNTARNFEDAQEVDNFNDANNYNLPIVTFVDKLPAKAGL